MATSQSKETTDTLAAVEAAHAFGGRVLAITTQGPLITREADAVLLTKARSEIGVAATKTFLTQVAALDLLALELSDDRDVLPEELLSGSRAQTPEKVEETLGWLDGRLEAANIFDGARFSSFIGRGVSFPLALEGSLKLKGISHLPKAIRPGR